ncbi:MAG: hypothetical protein ACFN26_03680, partial [Kingella denitrificans]
PQPSPVGEGWGEGKSAAMQTLKFALSEKALTLTLSRGRGDRFAANLKKQLAYWIWILPAKCRLPFGGNGKPTFSPA